MEYSKIWKKVLNTSEEVKYEFSVGNGYRKLVLGVWILLSLIFFAGKWQIGILVLILGIVHYWYMKVANAYAFTNKRVLIHRGWLSTHASSVNYEKITEVSISEPFLSRIFTKTGHMAIKTGNMTDTLILKNVASPYETKKKLDSLRNV